MIWNKLSVYIEGIIRGREKSAVFVLLSPFLFILSVVYAFGVWIHQGLYRTGVLKRFRAPVPVVSVGNIMAGGTGKTPFVIVIYQELVARGFHPCILTRGYKGGDEALMLTEILGPVVFSGVDRVASFRTAEQMGVFDSVILDDGFQHWRFERDCDIVLLDAEDPFGNKGLLPLGALREPLTALQRADVILLTRTDRVLPGRVERLLEQMRGAVPKAVLGCSVFSARVVTDIFSGNVIPFAAVPGAAGCLCAIGSPDNFRRTIEPLGIIPVIFAVFTDHHNFTQDDIASFVRACRSKKLEKIFMTHKDAVKMRGYRELFTGLQVMRIDIETKVVYGKNEFVSVLDRLHHS